MNSTARRHRSQGVLGFFVAIELICTRSYFAATIFSAWNREEAGIFHAFHEPWREKLQIPTSNIQRSSNVQAPRNRFMVPVHAWSPDQSDQKRGILLPAFSGRRDDISSMRTRTCWIVLSFAAISLLRPLNASGEVSFSAGLEIRAASDF